MVEKKTQEAIAERAAKEASTHHAARTSPHEDDRDRSIVDSDMQETRLIVFGGKSLCRTGLVGES